MNLFALLDRGAAYAPSNADRQRAKEVEAAESSRAAWIQALQHDRAVQLVEVSELEKERTARIEAQQRLADMQELAAKAGLAHMKAVADAVAEEVAAELEACEERVVSLFEVLETPYLPDITRAIRARGTPRHNNGEHDAI